MSVTQKQIAERLNISPSLVGRALSGHPEVAEKTRLRVEEVAKEMGYSIYANSAARALIARRYGQKLKKGVIAVAFPPLELSSPRHTPFYSPIMDGMEAEAARLGIELYMCMLRHNELPGLIREQGVDGVILMGASLRSATAVSQSDELGLPVLTVQWRCAGAHSVELDNREGARQATRYLLEQGHRRIGFLGIDGFKFDHDENSVPPPAVGDITGYASIQRLKGYLDAMGEYGVAVQEEWIEDSLPLKTSSGAYCPGCGDCASCSGWGALVEQNRKNGANECPFTALVCHNDSVAMGAVVQARRDGFDIPGDLSVIGFDHISQDFNFTPELTSLEFSRYEMGRSAVQLLSDAVNIRMAETASGELSHRVLPVELVIGDSTRSLIVTEAMMR